ncbi:MAG: diguanylate cyclase [Campylobacterales bacterium]
MLFPTLDSIASKDVIVIGIDATVDEALDAMQQSNHRMIVVRNRSVYHILRTSDLIQMRINHIPFSTPLKEVPLETAITMAGNTNIINVLGVIGNRDHEHICVVNEKGELVGLVTNTDIAASVDPKILIENMPLRSMFEGRQSYTFVKPDEQMCDVMMRMRSCRADCLIVQEENRPIGILTSKDILKFIDTPHNSKFYVRDFMSSPLETLPWDATISEALEFSRKKHFKRIVVTGPSNELVGIVTQKELIAHTYMRWSQLVENHFHELEELSHILEERNKQLAKMATHDALTQVYNRYFFSELFVKEYAYAQRYQGYIAVLLLDIDHFKQINDTYGHNVGDSVLREFSALCRKRLRRSDIFARWGGEEFVVLLPNTSGKQGVEVAEKIRKIVEQHAFSGVDRVTCSVGVAEVKEGDLLDDVVGRADEALYKAKESGRNRVVLFEKGN